MTRFSPFNSHECLQLFAYIWEGTEVLVKGVELL